MTAENTGYKLSQSGIIVVTGLALGVDTAATRGALRGGAKTIGVIGSGLDIAYPPENRSIYDSVSGCGAVISEYPPGTPALMHHFPVRNRIISGISLGVAVIEAPKRSGALITARRALEQGRDVFALPGNVDAVTCEGSNKLLREGAIPFMSADDIIDEYIDLYRDKINLSKTDETKNSFDNTTKVDYIDLGDHIDSHHKDSPIDHIEELPGELQADEKAVAQVISEKPRIIDEIISSTGLSAQNVMTALTMLELGGHIRRDTNGKWEIVV